MEAAGGVDMIRVLLYGCVLEKVQLKPSFEYACPEIGLPFVGFVLYTCARMWKFPRASNQRSGSSHAPNGRPPVVGSIKIGALHGPSGDAADIMNHVQTRNRVPLG